MKKSISNSVRVLCAASAAVIMSACQSKDLYDEDVVQAKSQAEMEARINDARFKYNTDFKAKYGNISPYQSWDFSSNAKMLTSATRGASDIKTEKVGGLDFRSRNNVPTKNEALYDAIKTASRYKKAQTDKPVVLIAPGNTFYVIPVSTCCRDAWREGRRTRRNTYRDLSVASWRQSQHQLWHLQRPRRLSRHACRLKARTA